MSVFFSAMLQSGETVCSREVHKVVLAPANLEDCERCVKFYILRCLKIQNANRVVTLQGSTTAAISSLNSRSFLSGCFHTAVGDVLSQRGVFLFLFVWTNANTTITL